MDDNGYFGNKDNNASHHQAMLLMPSQLPPLPPPPPPHPRPMDLLMSLSTTQEVTTTNGDGVAGTFFSPIVAGCAASSSFHLDNDQGYVFAPSHATMGGLWGEEDGEGRTAMGGGRRRDEHHPVGMDEGAASALAVQTQQGAVQQGVA
jgi:hypothetical protein